MLTEKNRLLFYKNGLILSMVLSAREELLLLIEKLPDSKVEKLLDIAENIELYSDNKLMINFEAITKEDDWVFNELAK